MSGLKTAALFGIAGALSVGVVAQHAAADLTAGDIAIIGFHSDPTKAFTFVTLTDVTEGEVIFFTDNGWKSDNTFRANEGVITYTVEAGGLSAGTIVSVAGESGTFNLSTSGDQILAYQGSASSPTFLSALNFNGTGTWQEDATNANTSALPTGLIDDYTAPSFTHIDNGAFNISVLASGTKEDWLTAIGNASNWTFNDTGVTLPSGTIIVTSGGGGEGQSLTWQASVDTNWNLSTQNFVNESAAASAFANGDAVTFADTGVGTVNISETSVEPASVVITNTSGTYVFTGGAIAGDTGITKTGAGTVRFENVNTYTGPTIVQDGVVTFTGDNRLPSATALSVLGGQVLLAGTTQTVGNVTVNGGEISGGTLSGTSFTVSTGVIEADLAGDSATFVKTGAGTATLRGTHSYTGATTIHSGGTLIVDGSVTSAVTVSGTLDINGIGVAGSFAATGMTFNVGSSLNFDAGLDTIDLGSGPLNIAGGTINFGTTGTIGQTYVLFTAGSLTGVNFTTGTKPAGTMVTYSFTGGEYTASFAAQVQGIGPNPRSFASNGPQRESFNGLATSGTTNVMTTLPDGFTFVKTNIPASNTYSANNGASNSGDVYSYGSSDDRALGSLASGTTGTIMFGVNFKNDTGAPMDQLIVSYTGEQWRAGGGRTADSKDSLLFEYSLDATSLTDGTWIAVPELDVYSILPGNTTGGAVDGNLPENQVQLSAIIDLSASPIAAGNGFWLRWTDVNISGNDDGLAIDNLTVIPEPSALSLLALGGMGLLRRRRRVLV